MDAIHAIEEIHRSQLQQNVMRIGLIYFGIAVLLLVTHHWLGELGVISAQHSRGGADSGGGSAGDADDRRNAPISSMRYARRSSAWISRVCSSSLGCLCWSAGWRRRNLWTPSHRALGALASTSHPLFLLALHWGAGGVSAVVDNVPMALGMDLRIEGPGAVTHYAGAGHHGVVAGAGG